MVLPMGIWDPWVGEGLGAKGWKEGWKGGRKPGTMDG